MFICSLTQNFQDNHTKARKAFGVHLPKNKTSGSRLHSSHNSEEGNRDSYENPKQTTNFRNYFMYTDREWDWETGLYYYHARYYDPMEGRFVQKDPIGFAGGDVNLFAYVKSNPVNFIDPMGLDAIPAPWTWGGAAEGVGTGASVSACGVLGGAAIIVAGSPTSTSICADYPQPKEFQKDKCNELNKAVQDAKDKAGKLGAGTRDISKLKHLLGHMLEISLG